LDELALHGHLALCLAMLGDTRRASRLINEACHRFKGMPTFLVMPWVAIHCRDGHLGAALKWLDESWPLVVKDGLACDRLRLLRAYAQSKVDPERHTASILLTLYGLAPFPKVELEFFREHWPVFADFLQRGPGPRGRPRGGAGPESGEGRHGVGGACSTPGTGG
jgi:hypothetical protein